MKLHMKYMKLLQSKLDVDMWVLVNHGFEHLIDDMIWIRIAHTVGHVTLSRVWFNIRDRIRDQVYDIG